MGLFGGDGEARDHVGVGFEHGGGDYACSVDYASGMLVGCVWMRETYAWQ